MATPNKTSSSSAEPRHFNGLDGPAARLATTIIDYTGFGLSVWAVRWATADDHYGRATLIPLRIGLVAASLVVNITLSELLYGLVLLGPKTLSRTKRIRIEQDAHSWYLMLFQVGLCLQLALMSGMLAHYGLFRAVIVPKHASAMDWIQALLTPYVEFVAIELLKDCTSMNFVHGWMHQPVQHPWLNKIHMLHHSPKADLNSVNGALIQPIDLFLENSIGPFLLVTFKRILLKEDSSISILSYMLLLACEGRSHSLNPYSICFFNPVMDSIFKVNVGHNLHHAYPKTNRHSIPWHHLWKGYRDDLEIYNRTMMTCVEM